MSTSTAHTDVTIFLTQQHNEVNALFNHLETMQASTSDEAQRLAEQVVTALVQHSVAEEIYLYPAVREHVPGGDEIADHELHEHSEAEQLMKRLESLTPADTDFWPTMRELMHEVRHHVEGEEGELFPKLRQACSPEQLQELGRKVQHAEKVAPTRPTSFFTIGGCRIGRGSARGRHGGPAA